jgi:hypothetical protein
VVILVIVGLFALALLPGGGPGCTSTWNCAPAYPIQVAGNIGVAATQCVANSADLYCIGGVDSNGGPHNEVYSGNIATSGNITGWTLNPNSYPSNISGESCVVSTGYVYCVGGANDAAGDDVASSYYAQLESGGGVGSWFYTTPYPVPVDFESCVAASSNIFCVGGNNETDGTDATVGPSSSVWFAPLSPTGIGGWTKTTPYPANAYLPSCFTTSADIYCLGGVDSTDNPLGNAYYATISATGIGEWIPTVSYPLPSTGPACVTSGGYAYCIGGATSGGQSASYTSAVYSAHVSNEGIGNWTERPDYPDSVATTCVIFSAHLYCIGGYDTSTEGENSGVRYASLTSLSG